MLLDEIITALSDEGHSITDALLKTKVLLRQTGKASPAAWVTYELNGYPAEAELPAFRILHAQVLANFANLAYQVSGHPIPLGHLTTKERESLEIWHVREALPALEEMTKGKSGQIIRPIPPDSFGRLGKGLDSTYSIQRAWCSVPDHLIKNIKAQVRSRLLDFVLDLKMEAGDASTDSGVQERLSRVDTASAFRNAVFGDNTTILIGDRNQQVVSIGKTGDWDGLVKALGALKVPSAEIEALKDAIAEDQKTDGKPSFGKKVGAWFSRLIQRSAEGSLDVASDVLSDGVVKAVRGFLGTLSQ